jgi:hypothetical protein
VRLRGCTDMVRPGSQASLKGVQENAEKEAHFAPVALDKRPRREEAM